jgi:dinuclear metal center YbgI/SA1388 family protein
MPTVQDICDFLERLAPGDLAEEWDNVGLLVGDRGAEVKHAMTCLTVTADSVNEASGQKADLVVTHHPLPFRPLKRLTSDTPEGRYLLELIQAGVAVYSAHTAFDSARSGINQQLAEGLRLANIAPLVVQEPESAIGSGRIGECDQPVTLAEFGQRLKKFLGIDHLRVVGAADRAIGRVAMACGSAGEFLTAARLAGADVLVTGETSFHTCLAAEAEGISLLLTGHYASERFAMEQLADELAREFSDVKVWASRQEQDPLAML